MNKSRLGVAVKVAAGMVVFLSVLIALGSAAYFLSMAAAAVVGLRLSPYTGSILTLLLGFFLLMALATTLGHFTRKKQLAGQAAIFKPIIDALEKIARGDFNIQLSTEFQSHEQELLGGLVESVNHMARQLNQTEQMRQEFISNVSHELQSPLTSIRGFALVLRNDGLTGEERAHYLEIIENESQRLSRITDNLLRLASLEADQAPFEPRLYRLDRQIREQILACEPQWSAKDIEMDVFLDEVSLNADADLLSQVWINLIHNSIKFTRPGGLVEMWLEQAGEWVEFKIRDSGPGIPDEDLGRVFERFYKADKARQRSKEGSGLGLSIAQKIVQMHGGEIWVERSQPGQNGAGAVFRVRLPAKR